MATITYRDTSRLIFVDELTGLYNRRFMRQYLRERFALLAQDGIPVCAIMLDLDDFKQVNDTHGHLEGDRVLQKLAQLLREPLVAPENYAIRFAGDEFIIFLEGMDGDAGEVVAEELRQRVVAEPFRSESLPAGIRLQASVGVAACPEDAQSPTDFFERLDKALYAAKSKGKNCVCRAAGWQLPIEVQLLQRFPCPRIVGRSAELEEVWRALRDTDGGNRFVLVEGLRGLGKSRLLNETMKHVAEKERKCYRARCLEAERSVPYSSLTPILTQCLARESGNLESVLANLPDPTLARLGTILPELEIVGLSDEPRPADERRRLLFHGVRDLLCLLSEEEPLIVLLDDFHFVDSASLDVLYRLLDHDEGHLVVCAAGRSDLLVRSDDASEPLVRLVDQMRQSPGFSSVRLGPLTAPEVRQMVAAILEEHTPSTRFFERLYEASGGIPLFVEETLKGLLVQGRLTTRGGSWDLDAVSLEAIPQSLEAAVREGLEVLDPETCGLISKAAVVGPQWDLTVLADLLGMDAGRTQQLVDRGTEHHVFEEPDAGVDEEEIRFLSQCFQEIVYTGLDKDDRRRTHLAVAEAAEALAGDEVERVLGPLAFHFERSDDQVKADFYRQRVEELSTRLFSADEVAREMDIQPKASTIPLDEISFPLAEKSVKALVTAIKTARMYPPTSQRVAETLQAASTTLGLLLERVEAVTFSEANQTLLANQQPLDRTALGPVVQDLLRIYSDHGIRLCTLQRGMTTADLMGLVRILGGPAEDVQHGPVFWDRRVRSAEIQHVHVFPVMYVAAQEAMSTGQEDRSALPLDESTLVPVREVLRSIAGAVDTIRLYPPGSKLITHALDQLTADAETLFYHVPRLTIGMTEGALVINATRPHPRQFGITTDILQKLMEDSGLSSLSIHRGVSAEDLRTFLTQLAHLPEEALREPTFWPGILEKHGITKVEVGSQVYKSAEVVHPHSASGETPESSETAELLRCAARWCAASLEEYLERRTQQEIPPALTRLVELGHGELAEQLVRRTVDVLGAPESWCRLQAAQGLTVLLAHFEDSPFPWTGHLLALADAVSTETDPKVTQAQVELAAGILQRLIQDGNLDRGSRLAKVLGESESRSPWAAEALWNLATSLAPPLMELILRGSGSDAARVAAGLLSLDRATAIQLTLQELMREPTMQETCGIVAVLDLLAPKLGEDFCLLLGHPEVQVHTHLAHTLALVPRKHALRFLMQGLISSEPEVVLGTLECVASLRAVELVPSLIQLLEDPPGESVLKATCRCLASFRDARAIAPLHRVLERRQRFLGLVKGLSEDTRAAAATALGNLGLPEVQPFLREASEQDPSPSVRGAARLALFALGQEI